MMKRTGSLCGTGRALVFAAVSLIFAAGAAGGEERRIELFAGFEPGLFKSLGSIQVAVGDGYRLGLGYFWSSALSTELSASIRSGFRDERALDTTLLYHFRPGAKWGPYVGAGLHYLRFSTRNPVIVVLSSPARKQQAANELENEELGLLLAAGIKWQAFQRAALRFDLGIVPVTFSGGEGASVSPSLGVGFRF